MAWSTLPVKTEQALTGCSDTATIGQYDTAWAITRLNRDGFGNVTASNEVGDNSNGSLNNVITTTFDSFYNLFPIEQARSGHYNTGFKETGSYYGVWSKPGVAPTISLSDSRAYWGAMAEYCALNNVCTRQSYDSFGRPINRWDQEISGSAWDTTANATVQWSYNAPNSISKVVNGVTYTGPSTYAVTEWHAPRCYGNFVRKLYDGIGQLVSEQKAAQRWEKVLDGCGTTHTYNEVDTYNAYNSLGQIVKTTVPKAISSITVDPTTNNQNPADGNTWWRRSPDWSLPATTITYDALGRTLKTVAPNGEEIQTHYRGRQTFSLGIGRNGDPTKVLSWQEADAYGNLGWVRSGTWNGTNPTVDNEIALAHDVMGNLTSVVNGGSGAGSNMTYDLLGHKLSMVDTDLGSWTYAYDRNGRLTRQTDGKNQTTCLYYEARLFRLAAKEYTTGTSCAGITSWDPISRPVVSGVSFDLQYQYDQGSAASRGQLTAVDYTDNHWDKALLYNSNGQLISETVSIAGAASNYTTRYGYDTYLRPQTTIYPDGEVLTTTYNSMGLPLTLTSSLSPTTPLAGSANYDEAGRLTRLNYPAGGNLWRTNLYYGWTLSPWGIADGNSNGRLQFSSLGTAPYDPATQNATGYNRMALDYRYDSFGNVKYYMDGAAWYAFSYDSQNRLTRGYDGATWLGTGYTFQVTANGQPYTYDSAGRLTNYEGSGYTAFRGHAVTHVGGTQRYWYDANGNMTTRWTPNGNQALAWDTENHLSSISGAGGDESYKYDADGQRVKKSEENATTYYPNSLYEVSTFTRTINNPGFESLSGWATVKNWPNTSFLQTNWGSADNRSGNYGVNISNHAYGLLESPAIAVTAGSTYSLTVWLRGEIDPDDSTGVYLVRAQFYNSSNVLTGTIDVANTSIITTVWTRQGGALTAPSGSSTVRIQLYSYMNDGWVAFDDVELRAMVGGVPGTNLVSNAGFESAGTWREVPNSAYPNTAIYRSTWGSSTPHSGSYAYVISNEGYASLTSGSIAVSANTGYDLAAYVRGQIDREAMGGELIFKSYFYNGTTLLSTLDKVIPSSTVLSSTGWINVSNRITTPVNTTSMKVEIHNGMFNGWIAYDDLTLKQVGSSTNLLSDPGFENATSGWTANLLSEFPTTMLWKGTWGPGAPRTGTYSYVFSNWADGYWKPTKVAARAGEQYDLYVWLKGKLDAETSQGKFLIRANFYDASGTFLSRTDITGMNPGAITTWTRVGGQVTAPANSASLEVQYLLYMSSGWVNIDDVEVTVVAPAAASEVTKYYYFGGQRVAMRKNGALTYLHGDHLGSTVLETNASGAVVNDEKYKAYGKQRDTGTVSTDHRFTGQKEDASGLQYFNARFYDPVIGMFVSPDTIVPDAGNVFDYNRFMYARGNAMKYNDPSGHCIWDLCIIEGIGLIEVLALAGGTAGYYSYALSPDAEQNKKQAVAAIADLVTDVGDLISPTSEQPSAPSVLADPLPTEQKPIVTTYPMADESPSLQVTTVFPSSSTETLQLPGFTLTQPNAGDQIVTASSALRPGKRFSTKELEGDGARLLRKDTANVDSQEFKDYMRSLGKGFKQSEWKYVMETWEYSDGSTVEPCVSIIGETNSSLKLV
ncbi:MAG: RHS repeat-associated core domain-containing protein [Caldilineaceae bacterium]